MKRFAMKRITAFALALIMTLSLCPVTAFATGTTTSTLTGTATVSEGGVAFFTDFDGTTLSSDSSILSCGNCCNYSGFHVYVVAGAAQSKMIYMAAPTWDTFTVMKGDTEVTPTALSDTWTNSDGYECYIYPLSVGKDGDVVEYEVTRRNDTINLTVDFTPIFSSGFQGTQFNMECGVAIFTQLDDNGALGYKENVEGYMGSATVVSVGKTDQTVYLAAGVGDVVTVDGVEPTQIGTWFNPQDNRYCKVYKKDVTKQTGDTLVVTVDRSGDENFPLTFDFTPVATNDGDWRGARGVFVFTGYDGTTLSCDMSSLTQWGDSSGEYMYLTCGEVASSKVYLAVNKYDTLSVNGTDLTSPVGLWKATFTNDAGEAFEQTCNIYEYELKPASGKTADYTVTRSWTYYDESTQQQVNNSEYFTLTADFAPVLTGNIEMGARNIVFFTDLNGTELICDTSSATQWGDANGEHVYFAYGDTDDDQKMYLATSPKDTIAVKNGTSNVAYTHVGTTTFKTQGGNDWLCKVYEVPVPVPTNGKTIEYTVEHEWTYWENNQSVTQNEDVFFTFDFSPEFTNTGNLKGMHGVFAFTELNDTNLVCDDTVMTWGNGDEHHMYIACDDVSSKTVYLAVNKWDELSVSGASLQKVGMWTYTGVDESGASFDMLCNVFEMVENAPLTGNVKEYTVTRSWTWYDETAQTEVNESAEFTLTMDFAPVLSGDKRNMECGVAIFSDLTNETLGYDAPVNGYGGYADVIATDKTSQTVYLATFADRELSVSDNAVLEQVGVWYTEAGNGNIFPAKVYKMVVDKPATDVATYTVKAAYAADDYETFELNVDFSPIFTANLRNMECGVAIFNKLENGVLSGDESISGLRGSAVVACEGSTFESIYLAVNMYDELIVNDGQQDLDLERVGMTTIYDQLFNVYKVNVPAGTDAVTYDVTRAWTWWDDNGTPDYGDDDFPVSEAESFPLTFDFELAAGEMPPLTIDGIKIYSYCANGSLGYWVPYTYDEMGADDDSNFIVVPGRPNQNKTIYLASSEKLYDADGNELPKCTNPATVGSRTVYMLTAEAKDIGNTVVNVAVGTPDSTNTITVRFVFFSVMFIGTSFYTTIDENFDGYFTYEDRTTCDGLSVEYLPVPGAEHFYLKVPYAVGQEKVLYINPDHGDIASVVATMGSLDAADYTLELIEDTAGVSGYSKYYKLTLSEELREEKNLMFKLYDENKEEIGNFDLIFRPIYEAKWGLATGNNLDEMPTSWTSGTLEEAMAYANGLTEGTAYIQLRKDMDTTEPLVFDNGKTTILDLNGYTIDRGLSEATTAVENGNVIMVNGDLTLCDTSADATGKITGGYAYGDAGGVVIAENGCLTLESGSIAGNSGYYAEGGVYVSQKGTFTMTGGAISDNTSTHATGGVKVSGQGTFTMTGGTITGNKGYQTGAVFLAAGNYQEGTPGGTFNMSGGSITGNIKTGVDTDYGAGGVSCVPDAVINLSGSATITGNTDEYDRPSNIWLKSNDGINVVGALTGSFGVSMIDAASLDDRLVVQGASGYTLTADDAAKFTSDSDDFMLVVDGSNLMLAVKRTVSFNANNGTDQTAKPFEVANGRKFKLPERPQNTITAPEGMQFKGWAYSADGAVITDSIITVTESITLYAIWENIPAEAPVVTVSDALTLTYGEYSDQKVSVTVAEQTGYTHTYQWYDTDNQAIVGATSDTYVIPNDLKADTYSYYCVVTAIRDDNDEEQDATSVAITVTVGKATPECEAPVAQNSVTYGAKLSETGLTADWSWANANIVPTVNNNGYTAYFVPDDTINYDWTKIDGWNEDVGRVERTVEVTVNKQLVDKPAEDATKFVYTGVEQTYTVAASELYTVSGTTRTAAGEQMVKIALTDKDNYAWVGGNSDDLEYTFSIAKAPLTITANAKAITYGAAPANDGVSYTGFVNSETEAVLNGTLSYSYNYKQYGDVGSYVITPAGLNSANYEITFVDGTLTVEQKEIGIKWGNTDLTYNGKAQAPEATATGMVNGDEVTLTVAGAQTNIGSYTATVTGIVGSKAGNYKLPSNVTTAFTVDYATVTFNTNGAGTIAAIENLTYGDKIDEPANPEKAKHTFAGWFSDEKCTKLWVFEKDTITGDMTLYAKWSENPVYDVSGIVYEQPGNDEHSQKVVANAHVQLVLGTTVIVEQTTNENGEFYFGGQEEGDYNLVVTHRHNNSKHDKVVTVLVALHEHNADDIEVVLPKGVTNSKVEHKSAAPETDGEATAGIAQGTLVGGLDTVAEAMRKQEEQKVDTTPGVDASDVIAKVEVTLTVEDTPLVTEPTTPEEEKVKEEQEAIQEKAPGKEIFFFDLSVIMSVTDNQDVTTMDYISDTGSLLEIRIPFEKGNKQGVVIYRYHDDKAEALPEVSEGSGTEGFWVGDDGYIHIYTHKFSTYAVGYTEPSNTPSYPGGYYPVVTPDKDTTTEDKPTETKPTTPAQPTTPPAEETVTPEVEDTTPVVPDEPIVDDPVVDDAPADDAEQTGSGAGLWIGIGIVALAAIVVVLAVMAARKKRK